MERGRRPGMAALAAALVAAAGCGDSSRETARDGGGDAGEPGGPDGGSGGGPWNPRAGPPTSRGLWIWYFARTGLTAAQAADLCRTLGVGYVLVKSGQDASYWSARYNARVSPSSPRGASPCSPGPT